MITHSKEYVTNLDEKCIQPNAVDIRAANLWVLDSHNTVAISETGEKQFASRTPAAIQLDAMSMQQYWIIPPHSICEYLTPHEVVVPEGYAGFINIRSTLARNGLISTNGIYDSGYKGYIGGTIHNPGNRTIMLEVNSRVAQYYMIKADTEHMYDGFYNKTKGLIETPADAS